MIARRVSEGGASFLADASGYHARLSHGSMTREEAMRDPVVEFQEFNRLFAKRNPELMRLKIDRMAAGPFPCFRGTFHLYARDMLDRVFEPPAARPVSEAELDLVGDIHCENYGTYKADDGGVHYDVNDFDETTQGRFEID